MWSAVVRWNRTPSLVYTVMVVDVYFTGMHIATAYVEAV
jgi:hypothetical protein